MAIQISCIVKHDRLDPTERIQSIGGTQNGQIWRLSLDDAIAGIEQGKWSFYVQQGLRQVDVIVSTSRSGRKYLRTVADSYEPNNLLSLPTCL